MVIIPESLEGTVGLKHYVTAAPDLSDVPTMRLLQYELFGGIKGGICLHTCGIIKFEQY